MTQWCLVKEFHKFLKNVNKMSDGQAAVSNWDDENLTTFKLQIKPHSGVYRGGTFDFTVTLPENFPKDPPHILCDTPIYHPNIDTPDEYDDLDDSNVCLNMFTKEAWQEGYGLDGIVQGVLFLFYEPNMDEPFCVFFLETNADAFEKDVLLSLKGGTVNRITYPWNYSWEGGGDGDNNENTEVVKGRGIEFSDTKNVNSVAIAVESTPDTDKGNVTDDNVSYGHEILKEVGSSENTCVAELRNVSNTAETAEETVGSPLPDDSKSSGLGITFKQKEHIAQASVISQSDNDQPDIIPLSSDDCSASCPPDVVTMTTDNSSKSQESYCRDFKSPPIQRRVCDICVLDKLTGRHAVSLHSFDSSIPEMNLVFTVLNKVTKVVEEYLTYKENKV